MFDFNSEGAYYILGEVQSAIKTYEQALEFVTLNAGARFSKSLVEDEPGYWQGSACSYHQLLALTSAQNTKQIEYARQRLWELGRKPLPNAITQPRRET
jgi:hypothetical protein